MADTSLLFPGSSSTLREDTDAFNARLREVNREMQNILDKTSQHRQDLTRWYTNPADVAPVAPAAAVAAPPPSSHVAQGVASAMPAYSSTAFEVTDELKQWIASQVKQYVTAQLPHVLEPLVEQQVGRHLQRLTNNVESLRSAQEDAKITTESLTEQWKDKQTTFAAAIARVESSTRTTLQHYQGDMEAHTRKWLEEVNSLRDAAAATERKFQSMEQRTTRRMEEVIQGHSDTVRSTLADLEQQVYTWKAQLDGVVREKSATLRNELDAMDHHVARLQGTLGSATQTISTHAVDIRTLMNGAVEQRAEMRACRRDVNRLEMLLQSAAADMLRDTPGGTGQGDNGAAFLKGLAQSSDHSTSAMFFAQELSKAKEQMSFLSGRLEGMERHMQHIDAALMSMGQTQSYGPRMRGPFLAEYSYGAPHSHHPSSFPGATSNYSGSMAQGPEDMSAGHSSTASPTASTRRPSTAVHGTGGFPSYMANASMTSPNAVPTQRQGPNGQGGAYPAGMNHSLERPMNVTIGSGANPPSPSYHSGTVGTLPSQTIQQQQQQLQQQPRSGFFSTSVMSSTPQHTTQSSVSVPNAGEDARRGSTASTTAPQPFEVVAPEVNRSLPQRRPLPAVIPVEEEAASEDEQPPQQHGDASRTQMASPHAAPGEPLEASRQSLQSSMQYSMLEDFGLGSPGSAGGGAFTGGASPAAEEDSYVSRTESRNRLLSASGSAELRASSQRAIGAHVEQYQPAPTSDTESERENQNLSRLQID